MTIQDAIQKMMDFYKAVEKVYADLPEEVEVANPEEEVANETKEKLGDCLDEVSDAMDELEKMQTVGVDCRHCKFYNAPNCNACKECMFFWVVSTDQKRPLNYEPL